MNNYEFGFLIVVTGHPYYGRMCYNCAMSIKAMDPTIPVSVAHNGSVLSHLDEYNLSIFDSVILMRDEVPANPQCKLYADRYTPYTKGTVVLDADTLWLPFLKPRDLFANLFERNVKFTAITEGKESDPNPAYFFWADPAEIKEKYTINAELHQWRTEFIFFTSETGIILERALEIVKTQDLKSIRYFAHNIPDELGINIATAEAGITPHIYKWFPTYWPMSAGGQLPALHVLGEKHYLLSFGSNVVPNTLGKMHDVILSNAAQTLRRPSNFTMIQKRNWDKQRDKM